MVENKRVVVVDAPNVFREGKADQQLSKRVTIREITRK